MNDGEPKEGESTSEPSTQEGESSIPKKKGALEETTDRSQLPAADISKKDLTRLINRIRKL